MAATKEQERKALEQIKKIVAGLGEDSYIGTAFEGCFEMAEQNIDNDWACSEKRLADAAAQRVDELEAEVAKLKHEFAEGYEEWSKAAAADKETIKGLKGKLLSPDDLTDCRQMTENLISELQDKVKAAEATILEYSEHPETTTFCDAVRERKNLTKDISYYQQLRDRLASKLS